jgi:hypothetical protein
MSQTIKFAALLFVCSLLTFTPGCGKNIKVTGTVSYEDGSPVQNGEVYLEGTVLGRGTITNGEFSLGLVKDGEGVPPGTYEVQCSKPLPELKADPSVEAYELVEPKEFTVAKGAKLNITVRKLTSEGPAAGEAYERAWEE